MLLLATFSSWQSGPALLRESLKCQLLLAKVARDCSFCEQQLSGNDGDADGDDWLNQVPIGSSRQVKLSVFTFLNTQSIA